MTVLFIVSGTTFSAPSDWAGTATKVEVIGGGAAGHSQADTPGVGVGAGAGAYTFQTSVSASNGNSLQVGAGGSTSGAAGTDTFFVSSATVNAKGAPAAPSSGGGAGSGGAAASCTPSGNAFSGGAGGTPSNSSYQGGAAGGGGAAGPNGAGGHGGNVNVGNQDGGTGGGGGGGGSNGVIGAAQNIGTAGGTGANGSGQVSGTNGGGGAANTNGTDGSSSSSSSGGGGGGGGETTGAGANGGAGTEWDGSHGSGGGGGGDANGSNVAGTHRNGGLYGGGGGGGGSGGGSPFGAGAQGIIVVTYTPAPWSTGRTEILLRNTAAFVSDPADGAHLINDGTSGDIPPYSGTGSQQLTANGNTFNIGWVATSGGANVGLTTTTANDINSSNDARVAGCHRPLAASASSLKVQAGGAAGTYSLWLGLTPETSLGAPGTLTIRDSNGTLATVALPSPLNLGQIVGADGTVYSSSSAWAGTPGIGGGAGVSIALTTTDTSNGNGGPFFYFDCGTAGSTSVPLSYIGLRLQTGSYTLTALTGSFVVGTLGLSSGHALTHQTITSSVGTITPSITTALGAETITTFQGLIFNFELSPQNITSSEGVISPFISGNVTLGLSALTAQFLGGAMGGGVGYILDQNSIIIVGQSASFVEGILAPAPAYGLTAQTLASSEGVPTEGLSYSLTALSIASLEGGIVANTGNNFNSSLFGQSALTSMGAVTGTLSYATSAETITSVLGSLTFSNTGNFTAQLVGQTLNSFVGVITVTFPGGMPNVIGQLLDDALLILQQVGVLNPPALGYFGTYPITVVWEPSSEPPSTVLSQSLSPGSTFTVNMPITLTCSEFPISVAFP